MSERKEADMKVFVAGATGRVGKELVQRLEERGHLVYAAARASDEITATDLVRPIHLDLHEGVEHLAGLFEDAEAVVFVAGSRGKDLLQTDLFGAVKLMQAAEQKGISRFIQLSSVFALQPEKWEGSPILNYNIAKYFSDSWLIRNTGLQYTILQPGTLEETPGSGKIDVDVAEPGVNSIENVAEVLACILEDDNTIGKVIIMKDGETPIKDALAELE